jgi:mycothiol synthase
MNPLPDGYRIRPVDPATDLPAVSALYLACDLADLGERDHQEDWITGAWRNAAVSAWVVEHEGAVVGYLELESYDPASSFEAYLPVMPELRDGPLRRALLARAQAEARERMTATEVAFRSVSGATDAAFAADAATEGMARVRTWMHMERALGPAEDPGEPPAGVTIRTARDPEDDGVIYGVLDQGFRGHFGFEPMTFEAWKADFKDGMYDAGLVLIAEVEGEPAGVAANWMPDGLGWVGDLAVLEAHRGRGIGRALLRGSFALLAARGATMVRLNVDAQNESGATRLYTSVGMTERRRFHVYEKRLEAAG